MIGRIERLPLRSVWKHEAHDFTVWLQENIEILAEVIDLNLLNAEREQAAGSFSVDILAETENGDPVIIENQLERSDHDHLGKLITYLTAFSAKIGIWIVAEPRTEHIKAVAWLNESTEASFYLLKVEAIKINDSLPAPWLTVIVAPSEEARGVGEQKRERAEMHHIRKEFWTELLEYAKTKTQLHANISPQYSSFVATGSGKQGLIYTYNVKQNETRVELYIDRGKDAAEQNLVIFDELFEHKEEIEASFGGSLSWQRLEGKRGCRIAKELTEGGYKSEDWQPVIEASVDTMIRLEGALQPWVQRLRI